MSAIAVALLLGGCGGGGGGGGGDSAAAPVVAATPQATTVRVSGQVTIPSAAVAEFRPLGWTERMLALVLPSAHARVGGMGPAPTGSRVELVRVNATGAVTRILTTATTGANGSYTLEASEVGLTLSPELVVRVVAPTSGLELRSLVYGGTVDVNPESEAVAQMLFARLAATPTATLGNVGPGEARTLLETAYMVGSAYGLSSLPGQTTDAISALKTRLNAINFNSVINDALGAGDSAVGPGDFADFFPLRTGAVWNYTYRTTVGAAAPMVSSARVEVTGPTTFRGVSAIAVRETESSGSGSTSYFVASNRVITKLGEAVTGGDPAIADLVAQFPTIDELRFPSRPGEAYVAAERTGIVVAGGTIDVRAVNTLQGYSTVTLAGGTSTIAKTVQQVITIVARSPQGATETIVFTGVTTYARGVGPTRIVVTTDTRLNRTTVEQSLTSYTVPPRP